jgi:hypothetical protein
MHTILSSCLILLGLGACAYNPPPDIELNRPADGAYIQGDTVVLSFSEAIDPASLKVRVWSGERDIENEIPAGSEPLLGQCSAAKSPCDTTTLVVAEDGLSAELNFDPEGLGKADVPMILEIEAGLSTEGGVETGISYFYDFQFRPDLTNTGDTIEFQDGYYLLIAKTDKPVKNVVITIAAHVKVLSDGRMSLAGVRLDPIEGAPEGTEDLSELLVNTDYDGFGIFTTGTVALNDGERFLESEFFEVSLKLGPITIQIQNMRLTGGKIEANPDTGLDEISGTLSYESMLFSTGNSEPFEYVGDSTSFYANRMADEDVPEGVSDMCGNQCGAATAQCDPPEGFPALEFCSEDDE